MGRWSKQIAPLFLNWLNLQKNLNWIDLGCGTGALSESIFKLYNPAKLISIDPSNKFLEKAKERLPERVNLLQGDASAIPCYNNSCDAIVSGLALNFFTDLEKSLSEMKRVTKSEGVIASYVWDYAGRMDFLRIFWDAACQLDPDARKLDEGSRFPICNLEKLSALFQKKGFTNILTTTLDMDSTFEDFDDFWNPFLGGQGPAPSYLASLSNQSQQVLKEKIHDQLPFDKDGSIKLLARALAIKAKV